MATLLARYVDSMVGVPLCYREHCCATFIAGWIDTLRADNKASEYWQGQYSTEEEAVKFIKNNGGFAVVAGAALEPFAKPVKRREAATGDVCMVVREKGFVMGILGHGGMLLRTDRGYCRLDVGPFKVWRVIPNG